MRRASACTTASTRSASPIPARSRCTTTRARCRASSATTAEREHRPLGRRPRAHPPPRRAALQRLPRRAAQAARHALGRAVRRSRERARIMRELYRTTSTRSTRWSACSPNRRPQGFGFSDTAFRIFILMASRRLQSDRFLTVDFRPEIYSPFGMDWIANNGMTSVILRHCPELAAMLPRDASAFAPWRLVAQADMSARPRPTRRPRRAAAALARRHDLAPAHASGEPRQQIARRRDELPKSASASAALGARGGDADRRDRLHRPDHAGPAVLRSAHDRADHGQAEPQHGRRAPPAARTTRRARISS